MSDTVSEFWRQKYETDARKNWDVFYKTHATNFFKDRHWLAREWPDVFAKPPEEIAREDVDEDLGARVDLARGPAPSYAPREDAPRARPSPTKLSTKRESVRVNYNNATLTTPYFFNSR